MGDSHSAVLLEGRQLPRHSIEVDDIEVGLQMVSGASVQPPGELPGHRLREPHLLEVHVVLLRARRRRTEPVGRLIVVVVAPIRPDQPLAVLRVDVATQGELELLFGGVAYRGVDRRRRSVRAIATDGTGGDPEEEAGGGVHGNGRQEGEGEGVRVLLGSRVRSRHRGVRPATEHLPGHVHEIPLGHLPDRVGSLGRHGRCQRDDEPQQGFHARDPHGGMPHHMSGTALPDLAPKSKLRSGAPDAVLR